MKPRKPRSSGVTIDKLFNFSKPVFSSDNEDNMTNIPNCYRNEMEYSVYTALSRSSVNGIYHYSCYYYCQKGEWERLLELWINTHIVSDRVEGDLGANNY